MIIGIIDLIERYIYINYSKVFFVIISLLIGSIIICWVRKGTHKILSQVNYDETLEKLIKNSTGAFLWIILIIFIMSNLGFNVTGFVAGLGITGIIIGFATKDIFSNFAAGLLILFSRPFRVGSNITSGGVTGDVKEINLSYCVISNENAKIIIPNTKIWGGSIIKNKKIKS